MTGRAVLSDQKRRVLSALVRHLVQKRFGPGDRITSERHLTGLLETSRGTVREVVRAMEAKGWLRVKPGSGIYLLEAPHHLVNELDRTTENPRSQIKEILEASLMVYPLIITLAVKRRSDLDVSQMKKQVVALSRGIIQSDGARVTEADRLFFHTLARMTGNSLLMDVTKRLASAQAVLWRHVIGRNEFTANTLFASYVGIVNGVKAGRALQGIEEIRQIYQTWVQWFGMQDLFGPVDLQKEMEPVQQIADNIYLRRQE